MAEQKIYIGSVGPFLFEDTDPIDDEDGDFSGETQQAMRTAAPIRTSHSPSDDNDVIRLVDMEETKRYGIMNIPGSLKQSKSGGLVIQARDKRYIEDRLPSLGVRKTGGGIRDTGRYSETKVVSKGIEKSPLKRDPLRYVLMMGI